MRIAFIDTETTGLTVGKNRVLEAAVVVAFATPKGLIEEKTFELRQKLDLCQVPWHPRALKVNGYFDGHPDWDGAPKAGSQRAFEMWSEFSELLTGAVLCSQNVSFDRDFIKAELAHFDLEGNWSHRAIDLMSFSALVGIKQGAASWGLHAVYETLDGPKLPEHRAMADVRRGMFVYEKVAGAFFAA